ncbi:cobalamin-dependent protein [Ruegeria sp.]|uniref:cobalamin-dependent protein n=1 Tax=Ruegeria sp. TaxID=1879320 RepID=UPI003B5C53C5
MTDIATKPLTAALLPEQDLPSGADLLNTGRKMARDWSVGDSLFHRSTGFRNEVDYKRAQMRSGRVMQHAHLGFRDLSHSVDAIRQVYYRCAQRGAQVDRFGMCLDWSMGFPRNLRTEQARGTGILLNDVEAFAQLTQASPAAMHFGDFMLGFPAALENTCAALAAGATAIGNLGQYFTFRLPGHDDDVETTQSTVQALGLIAAQPIPVLVHSNLDDGFAAVFEDLTSALGQALLEKYIVTDLIGAPYAVCYGHHFTEPLTRIAFQRALARISDGIPGSQIYGATVLYKGTHPENYAGLSSYLLSDIVAQKLLPTGHALNPVPVSENERIPDVAEICDAQCHLNRLVELADGYVPLFDTTGIEAVSGTLLREGQGFADRVLAGLSAGGIDTTDPFQLLLALRRLGGRTLEETYGAGALRPDAPRRRTPIVGATTYQELEAEAEAFMASDSGQALTALAKTPARILTATTDVHEHGKMLLDLVFGKAGFAVEDGGVSSDPEHIVALIRQNPVDAIALSTYNGVALRYAKTLLRKMKEAGLEVPILIGGRLNEIPEASNTSLPVDVSDALTEIGVVVCSDLDAATNALSALLEESGEQVL